MGMSEPFQVEMRITKQIMLYISSYLKYQPLTITLLVTYARYLPSYRLSLNYASEDYECKALPVTKLNFQTNYIKQIAKCYEKCPYCLFPAFENLRERFGYYNAVHDTFQPLYPDISHEYIFLEGYNITGHTARQLCLSLGKDWDIMTLDSHHFATTLSNHLISIYSNRHNIDAVHWHSRTYIFS